MAYSQHEILATGLKNAYALEEHAADVTENQASRLDDYPELQRRVQQHHEETLRQRDRLGELPEPAGRKSIDVERHGAASRGQHAGFVPRHGGRGRESQSGVM
jgi:ferritin-like metal-binding protein YciE